MAKQDKMVPLGGEKPVESLRILEATQNDSEVRLRVEMPTEFRDRLHEFLKQKGYAPQDREREGLLLLVEFGLSRQSRQELGKKRDEMWAASSRYASTSFRTAQLYAKNKGIVMGLRLHLQENRSLKRDLEAKGMGHLVSEDDWDNWDEEFIDSLYRKYVFCK